MAKVFGIALIFCVVFLLNLNYCNSFQNENLDHTTYNVLSKLEELPLANVHYIHLIKKRQTGAATEYKRIPDGTLSTDINLNVTASNYNMSDVKQEPPGALDSGGNSTVAPVNMTIPTDPTINKPLLGVNGTGQRKEYQITAKPDIVSQPINPMTKITKLSTPKKANSSQPMSGTDDVIDGIDRPENDTNDGLKNHNITSYDEDYHLYYNSTVVVDKDQIQKYWDEYRHITANNMLSQSHRRAMTVYLTFDFPFYGHRIRNVTVATGGFLYTGDYVHSWLAATQYIAPLMANFDTSLSNDSFVKFADNGTAFTVLWENVVLQDKQDVGTFTFATTLHKNGDIVFTYFSVPIQIEAIQDDKHPVKVGLSDAYIIDKIIFFARRKTIYEYHRVNFQSPNIQNSTIIYLNALPTCLGLYDCVSCLTEKTNFNCIWCPTLNKCSTGTDRKRQDWLHKGCDKTQIIEQSLCPVLGEKGNNAAQQSANRILNNSSVTNGESNPNDDYSSEQSVHNINAVMRNIGNSQMEPSTKEKESKSVGLVLGFMLPICLIMSALVWVLYAYRNPHTKSGQLLIQYRPSQWTWRRGEARYTAATIHM